MSEPVNVDAQGEPQPIAWMVVRAADPTFPRFYRTRSDADAMVDSVNVHPYAEAKPLYAAPISEGQSKSPLHAPEGFRVVPVRVLQSAYDRIDAMLASSEPDLRAANSVRIELRHLINETYALPSTMLGSGK